MAYKIPTVKSKHYDKYYSEMASQKGKTIAITGTSTGLGQVAARAIALKGGHVLALNRPSERATASSQAIRDELVAQKSEGKVTDIPCNLQSLESVEQAAAKVTEVCGDAGLDAMVCNAGIMAMPDKVTADGFPQEMQTNHLSHFKLCSKLFPAIKKAADRTGSARIVTHTSGARKAGSNIVNPDHYKKHKDEELGGMNNRWERYHQSKMANTCFVLSLKDKLAEKGITNIIPTVATPGLAASSLQANTSDHGGGFGLQTLMKFSQSAEDGTLPLLHCIVGSDVKPGDLMNPGKKGIITYLYGDGVVGWPAKRDMSKEGPFKQVNKDDCWKCSEEAVGPFF